MNSRGFVIYAEGETHLKQAYLAALSLQAAGNGCPTSVITNCSVSRKFRKAFDKIIEIPWYEESQTDLCAENRWKIYHATPYKYTIVLDSDVLVLENLEYFWDFVKNYELYFPTEVFTYRKEKITGNYYRKAFTENKLPNFYNCVHYFSKSQFAQEFYAWVELVNNNWELFYGKFCAEHYPKQPSMDVTVAIVSKILDCDTEISNLNNNLLEIVHMKPMVQNWKNPKTSWQSNVGVYLTEDLQLKIGNHRQDTIFHYTENSFCQDDIIRKFEECLNL
jgi:hypothetical protein